MKIKQGGYGILDDTFWVQRMSRRGFHVVVLTLSGKGKYLMEDGTEHTAKPGEAFISNAMGQGHHEETVGPIPWEMIWLTIWEENPAVSSAMSGLRHHSVRQRTVVEVFVPFHHERRSVFRHSLIASA